MAATLEAEYTFGAEDLGSRTNIVKFAVVQRHEEQVAAQEHELASFEAMMLPCMDAAHNLARWLLRNEQDAQDVVQEAYLRAFHRSRDSMAQMAGPGCSLSSETLPIPCSKRIRRPISQQLLTKRFMQPGTSRSVRRRFLNTRKTPN